MPTRNVAAALVESKRAYFALRRYAAIRPADETMSAVDRQISGLEELLGEAGLLRRLAIGRLIARYKALRTTLSPPKY